MGKRDWHGRLWKLVVQCEPEKFERVSALLTAHIKAGKSKRGLNQMQQVRPGEWELSWVGVVGYVAAQSSINLAFKRDKTLDAAWDLSLADSDEAGADAVNPPRRKQRRKQQSDFATVAVQKACRVDDKAHAAAIAPNADIGADVEVEDHARVIIGKHKRHQKSNAIGCSKKKRREALTTHSLNRLAWPMDLH